MPAAAEHGQPAAAEHGRTSLQRYMRTFGFGEPLEIRDGKTMLHYLARQSEVAAEGNTVLAAWFELLQVYCLRRPASWLEFAILVEAPRLPVGWTALDILANSYADVAPRMVQQLLEAGAELSPRSRARSTRPLHAALRNGNGEVVDILLAAKADPHARTQLGFSCADLAPTPTLKELFRNLGVGADETDPDPAPPSRAKPAPPRAPSSYGAQPATPPPPPPTSSRDVPAAAEHGQPAAAEHGRTSGIPMEVLAWGDAATLNRPCVDCSRVTGCFCDGCFAIERDPDAYWAPGQHTPLCTACDAKHGECHHCRGLAWVAPRVWGDGATMAGYQAEAHRTGPSASFGLPRGAS